MAELLKLKADYKTLTGEDLAGGGSKGKKDKKKEAGNKTEKKDAKPSTKQEKMTKAVKVENGEGESAVKKVTRCDIGSKAWFRRRTFHEPNLIPKYVKSLVSESIRNTCFNLERLSCSFHLAQPKISPFDRL